MSKPATLERHENGRYYIHWIEGRRTKRASTGKRDVVEAQKFFAQWLLNDEQAAKRPDKSNVTFAAVWDFYIEEFMGERVFAPSAKAMGRYMCSAFGEVPVSDLSQAHIDKYVRNRRAGRIGTPAKASTVWLEVGKAKAAVNYAIKRKVLPATARLDLEPMAPPEARDRWLRQEETAKLTAAAERLRKGPRLSRVERFLALALETGARRKVIETLKWEQVDLEAGVIHYQARGIAKTSKKRPSVPISSTLRPVLERAFDERCSDYVLDTPGAAYKLVAAVAKEAGVAGIHPHVLRHTAATQMARRGVPLWKIAGILGNTMKMVEQVYAKHSPDGLADAVEQISGSPIRRVA